MKQFRWRTIKEDLLSEILKGNFRRGQSFYTISEITKLYKVSEITSRRVLSELSRDNWIKTVPGRGTFLKRSSLSQEIKFVLADIDNPSSGLALSGIHPEVLQGIMGEVEEMNCHLRTLAFPYFNNQPEPNSLILIAHGIIDEIYDSVIENKCICVWANACRPIKGISTIRSGLKEGAYLATRHLLDKGHCRIGFLTGKLNSDWFSPHFDGYYQALKENDLSIDLSLIRETSGRNLQEDWEAVNQLMPQSDPPTAIYAANTYRALHILQYSHEKGIKVPQDLAIVAFGNNYESSISKPSLTVVDPFLRKQGKESVKLLIEIAENGGNNLRDMVIEPELIVRESS